MDDRLIKVLLIEDNHKIARSIWQALKEQPEDIFELEWKIDAIAGMECLLDNEFDAVLLDIWKKDCVKNDIFNRILIQVPDVAVITICDNLDEKLLVKALRAGAQDCLEKENVDSKSLVRAIRFAVERQRQVKLLRGLSLFDELTGLYNRRGFVTLSEQQLKIVQRTGKELLIIYADMDGLKKINDTYGHIEGDQAIIEAAGALKKTFRKSDIVARIGGDEFAIMALDAKDSDMEIITKRLQKNIDAINRERPNGYSLSMSVGSVMYDPKNHMSISKLIDKADSLMYKIKKHRKESRVAEEKSGGIRQDIELAERVQRGLLPKQLPESDIIKFAWEFKPSVCVAGDIFNVVEIDESKIGFYMLDVMGHGISATFRGVAITNFLKIMSFNRPSAVLKELNKFFISQFNEEDFATFFYGVINTENLVLDYGRAGHCPPILIPAEGQIIELRDGGPAIGFAKDNEYKDYSLKLNSGDKVFLYTDGITTVRGEDRKVYSKARLLDFINLSKNKNISELVKDVINEITLFCGGQKTQDDSTILAIEIVRQANI
jgi:two-component system cell cycle response regulator